MGTRLYVAGPESFMGLGHAHRAAVQSQQGRGTCRGVRHAGAPRVLHPLPRPRPKCHDQHRTVTVAAAGWWCAITTRAAGRLHGVMVDAEVPGELARDQRGFPVTHADHHSVRVVAVEQVTPQIKHFKLAPTPAGSLTGVFGRLSHHRRHAGRATACYRNPYLLMSSPTQLDNYEISVLPHGGVARRLALHARELRWAASLKSPTR